MFFYIYLRTFDSMGGSNLWTKFPPIFFTYKECL